MKENVFVGISGFSYPGWKGKVYPKDMKSDDFLRFYSQRLKTVEVNSSFYAPPSPAIVKSWSASTGDSFKFAFKAPRQITHILKLGKGSLEAAGKLSRTLELLGSKRGPLLFQLPPYSKQDLKLLEGFLSQTAEIAHRVFEFRHKSWMEKATYELLDQHGAGFCIAETEDMEPVFQVTGKLAYFRLRNESYHPKSIDKWAGKILEAVPTSRETFVYLRHDETGENAILAEAYGKTTIVEG